MTQRGVTLVEFLLSAALLVSGGGILALWIRYAGLHMDYLGQSKVAMNAAQGLLERLAATDMDVLWTQPEYAAARGAGQRCWVEDLNCNGFLEPGEDMNDNGTLDSGPLLNGGALTLQIRQPAADRANNPGRPSLLDLHVAACWRSAGHPIGEDQNCNGVLDPGEDTRDIGWIDSPIMVSTRVARGG